MSKFNFNIDIDIDNNERTNLSKQYNDHITLKQLYDVETQIIDLGLPSGTKWYKYNVGVNPYKLDTFQDWYGNYYAWGETKQKTTYNWETYKYCKVYYGNTKLTKYCSDSLYGYKKFEDDLIELQLEDDVAYQNINLYNHTAKIPSKKQFEELLAYTEVGYKLNHKGIKDLNGRLFKSKVNDAELFFPYAGSYKSNEYDNTGFYWTSTCIHTIPSLNAWCLQIDNTTAPIIITFKYRYMGIPIRPIIL